MSELLPTIQAAFHETLPSLFQMSDSFLYISGGACGRSWETRSVFQAIVENAAAAFVTSSQPSPNPNAIRAARASRVFHNRGSVHRPYPLAQIRSQENDTSKRK